MGNGVCTMLGNGGKAFFWLDRWACDVPLKELYPRLFLLATNKNAKVKDMGEWVGPSWNWFIIFRRSLLVWEEELFQSLLNRLSAVRLCKEAIDKYIWKFSPSGLYSVKLCCHSMEGSISHFEDVLCG